MMTASDSISSPNSSMRRANSSYAGHTSTVSPRTRKVPRVKAMSLRWYWMSTRRKRKSVAVHRLALDEVDHHALVVAGRAEAVDARHARDDDDVLPADEGAGGGEAEAVDVLVDEGVFFDVDVALRDVGFGLIVVVVADEVMDGVLAGRSPLNSL